MNKGADVDARDASGRIPLDHAVSMGEEAIQAILKASAMKGGR